MEKILADRTSKIDASGIRKVFALAAQLENPINFSIGQPDFDVPEPLKEEAIKAIREGFNKYSQTAGDSLLKEKISELLKKELCPERSRRIGWENPAVLVTSGVSGGLLLAFLALINPGDEVIMTDPYFVIYKHVINMLGGKCVFVDSYESFALPVERIDESITSKTKMIILNSPCNPTGVVHPQEQIKKLAEVAAEKDILILADEVYEKFCYEGKCSSIANFYEKALILRGFSKPYAMTGWRLGFAAAHQSLRNVIEEMTKIQQYTFVCAPTPFQKAAIAALDYDVTNFVDMYRGKRDLLYEGLKDKFELVRPSGAFYAFVKAPGGSATQFVEKAIKNNVLIIPGSVFSEKDTHFRISFATSNDKIQQGVEILRKIASCG
ncbi:MAG: pyridoxal phosphate-dependent aminotransferase [Phycisphaerae bacterium]